MISVRRLAGTPSTFAKALADRPSGTRYSSRKTSPGWVRRRRFALRPVEYGFALAEPSLVFINTMLHSSSFRGERSASPESITTSGGYGFRAHAKTRVPE